MTMDRDAILQAFLAQRLDLLAYLGALLPAGLVEDVFQETFLVVARRWQDFDATRPFGPWCRGIARNLARKACAVRRAQPFDEHAADLVSAALDTPDPEPALELTQLRHCLQQIDDRQRGLLERFYAHGDSLALIAQASGRSVGAVQVALSRLRASLLRCIEHRLRTQA